MGKRVYISADYDKNGDIDVVDELHKWGNDNLHKVDYIDTAQVVSGSIAKDPDCRACDLKQEFNNQINVSSAVIFIIGDKTATRKAGALCLRRSFGASCQCTPYKQNSKGSRYCKKIYMPPTITSNGNVRCINTYSYLEHEFRQAVCKSKRIIIIYNSFYAQPRWLPSYMKGYKAVARPFWKRDALGKRVGDYSYIKKALGYE